MTGHVQTSAIRLQPNNGDRRPAQPSHRAAQNSDRTWAEDDNAVARPHVSIVHNGVKRHAARFRERGLLEFHLRRHAVENSSRHWYEAPHCSVDRGTVAATIRVEIVESLSGQRTRRVDDRCRFADGAIAFLNEVGHDACGLNPDIGNFVRLHRPLEPVAEMLDKLLPHTNYWHVKNYLRDEDPATGQVMTFPVPMDFGLINYRAAITQAIELGFRGAFLCEHYGSDAITVIAKNRAYIRDILATVIP